MNVVFLYPSRLLFLFFIPLLIFVHFFSLKVKASRTIKLANFEALARVRNIDFFSRNITTLVLSCLIIFLLSFALAGARMQLEREASSHSFVVAIDSSRSMQANDFSPSRLEAAKSSAIEFARNAPFGTRMGIISFSGTSLIKQEVTDDMSLVQNSISSITFGPIEGTDFYEAIVTSSNLLIGEEDAAIILVSDGQINIGKLEDAINYARRKNIIVNAVGIGTESGGDTPYGISTLDESSLMALAHNTGGAYYRAQDITSLNDAFQNSLTLKRRLVSLDIVPYLVVLSIILFAADFFLSSARFRGLP